MQMISTTLGEIADIITGPFGSQLHMSDYVDEGIAVIMPQNIGDRIILEDKIARISKSDYKRLKKYQTQKEDIVYSRRGDVEKHAFINGDKPYLCGTGCLRVRANKEKVYPRYLSLFLSRPETKRWLSQHAIGSNMMNINTSILGNVPVFLPDRDIQIEIAESLQGFDDKIQLNIKMMKEMEEVAKLIYSYWFLQFEFPDKDGKPYKSSGGKMVWNDELKSEIPEGWRCDALKKYIKLTKGISYTSKNIKSGKGVPMINLASIDTNRNYKPDKLKFYDGEYNEAKEAYPEEMLIACTDLTINAYIVGSPILVPNIEKKYLYSMDLVKLNPLTDELDPMYLYMTLRTETYHNYIKGFATGTNVLHLNTDGIEGFKVCFPCKKLQRKFSLLIKEIHKTKSKLIKENRELIAFRDFLLPLLMNGQVGFKK